VPVKQKTSSFDITGYSQTGRLFEKRKQHKMEAIRK
jgi:hypothetical protein